MGVNSVLSYPQVGGTIMLLPPLMPSGCAYSCVPSKSPDSRFLMKNAHLHLIQSLALYVLYVYPFV